jgi:hypothetical protein
MTVDDGARGSQGVPRPSDNASLLNASPAGVTDAASTAVAQIQTTTKWLIGAIGAVAVVVLAGVQLSSIGSLHGNRFEDALVWPILAIAGILLALGMATRVLAPRAITIGDLLDSRPRWIKSDPAFNGVDLAALNDMRKGAAKSLYDLQRDLLEAHLNNFPNAPLIQDRVTKATENLAFLDVTVNAIEWLARYHTTTRRFQLALIALVVAIIAVLTGTLGFLSSTAGANAAESQQSAPCASLASASSIMLTADLSTCATITQLTPVTVLFSSNGKAAYEKQNPGCVINALPYPVGDAISGTWAEPVIVLIEVNGSGRQPCISGDQFEMKMDYGRIVPRQFR